MDATANKIGTITSLLVMVYEMEINKTANKKLKMFIKNEDCLKM